MLHKDHLKKQMKNLDKEQVELDLSLKFGILKIIHEHMFFKTQIYVCCFSSVHQYVNVYKYYRRTTP